MTEQNQTPVETDAQPDPSEFNPDLRRCSFQMSLNTYDVESLREAFEVLALNYGRYGIRAFFVVATDPDTNTQYVIEDGERIFELSEWEKRGQGIDVPDEEPDPALEEAIDHIVDAKLRGDYLEESHADEPGTTG